MPLPKVLTTITPLSKTIALILFFSLPAAGFFLGMRYQQQMGGTLLPPQQGCTLEAKLCPDGSAVGRSGPNCEFAPCPSLSGSIIPNTKNELFLETNINAPTSDRREAIRTRYVAVNFDLIEIETNPQEQPSLTPKVLTLNLFQDARLTAIITRIEQTRPNVYAWSGTIQDIESSTVTLIVDQKNKMVLGSISSAHAVYTIEYAENGVHAIHQIDQSRFPAD